MQSSVAVPKSPLLDMQHRFGYIFKDESLLDQALSHKSCGRRNNERLEFLGDSILNFAAAEFLFDLEENLPEGSMSRMRASLVRQDALVKVAERVGLAPHLKVVNLDGSNETMPSMLADALEAMFAAVYREAGFTVAVRLIKAHLRILLNHGEISFKKDAKTRLQELVQSKAIPLPVYSLVSNNNGVIKAQCLIASLDIATTGLGQTKKAAEIQAAESAIRKVPR